MQSILKRLLAIKSSKRPSGSSLSNDNFEHFSGSSMPLSTSDDYDEEPLEEFDVVSTVSNYYDPADDDYDEEDSLLEKSSLDFPANHSAELNTENRQDPVVLRASSAEDNSSDDDSCSPVDRINSSQFKHAEATSFRFNNWQLAAIPIYYIKLQNNLLKNKVIRFINMKLQDKDFLGMQVSYQETAKGSVILGFGDIFEIRKAFNGSLKDRLIEDFSCSIVSINENISHTYMSTDISLKYDANEAIETENNIELQVQGKFDNLDLKIYGRPIFCIEFLDTAEDRKTIKTIIESNLDKYSGLICCDTSQGWQIRSFPIIDINDQVHRQFLNGLVEKLSAKKLVFAFINLIAVDFAMGAEVTIDIDDFLNTIPDEANQEIKSLSC